MNSGPEPEAAPPPPEPELPGEFVSETLRDDCARFLDDLRRRAAVRRESGLNGGWFPGSRIGPPGGGDPPRR